MIFMIVGHVCLTITINDTNPYSTTLFNTGEVFCVLVFSFSTKAVVVNHKKAAISLGCNKLHAFR